MFRRNLDILTTIVIVACSLILILVLFGCKVEGRYANAGDPCYLSGQEAVDEDSGHALICKRDKKGDLTWLVK